MLSRAVECEVIVMAQWGCTDKRRALEFYERGFSESILGEEFSIRVYNRHGDVSRGTAMIREGDTCHVHTAYLWDPNMGNVGTAVGVMFDRDTGSISVLLAAKSDRQWTQSEIAEAVDYWEKDNTPRIYCLREKSCGAVVFTGEGSARRYLIIRMNLGHCGLPKGHVEKYENEYETALREVREETGVDISLVDGFRETVIYSLTGRITKESVYFLGKFTGDDVKIQISEVSSYRLCGYEEARALITYANDRAVLDAAHHFLESYGM